MTHRPRRTRDVVRRTATPVPRPAPAHTQTDSNRRHSAKMPDASPRRRRCSTCRFHVEHRHAPQAGSRQARPSPADRCRGERPRIGCPPVVPVSYAVWILQTGTSHRVRRCCGLCGLTLFRQVNGSFRGVDRAWAKRGSGREPVHAVPPRTTRAEVTHNACTPELHSSTPCPPRVHNSVLGCRSPWFSTGLSPAVGASSHVRNVTSAAQCPCGIVLHSCGRHCGQPS